MPRTFAYLRVSTTGQTTDNQLQEVAGAGFKVEPRRDITETGSGNVATAQRRGFTRLLDGTFPDNHGARVSVVGKTMPMGSRIVAIPRSWLRARLQ